LSGQGSSIGLHRATERSRPRFLLLADDPALAFWFTLASTSSSAEGEDEVVDAGVEELDLEGAVVVDPRGRAGCRGRGSAHAITGVDDRGDSPPATTPHTLTLDPPPPADAFRSLTMCDMPNHYLIDNPIDRYSISDRTPGTVTGTSGHANIVRRGTRALG
jgi:hypothetical protein